jgi:hypothetical protein
VAASGSYGFSVKNYYLLLPVSLTMAVLVLLNAGCSYCKCEMPYNPDDLMVHCELCKDWYALYFFFLLC